MGLSKKNERPIDESPTGEGTALPIPEQATLVPPDHGTTDLRPPTGSPGGKVRLSVDIPGELYQRLRIFVAKTNSRINVFIEDLIGKNC